MNIPELLAPRSAGRRSSLLLTGLLLLAAAGCHDDEGTGPAPSGTVAGTITSSLGGPLKDVHVSVDPDGDATAMEVATDSVGRYTVNGVPAGAGSVTVVDGVPSNCSAPAAQTYDDLVSGASKTVDIELPCDATTGALTISIAGLVDIAGSVHVTGPNSFDTTLTATSTLAELAPGSYTISADTLVVSDPVVVSRYIAVIDSSPATVVAGDTGSVAVTYAIRTGSGGLWFTNVGNGKISRFAAGQLHESGSPTDTTSITGPSAPASAAFDSAGNLWVSSVSGNKLAAYTRDQLVGGGTPTPLRTISGSLDGPVGLAFDDDGSLWVSNVYANSIVGFTAAQVKAGGTPTPTVTITSSDLESPDNMAFDAAGNLWVVNNGGNSVVEFSSSQLAASGNIAAAVKITTSGSLNFPSGLAFDSAGNLWVANRTDDSFSHLLVSFTPDQLAAGGTLTPSVTIDYAGDLYPGTLAFDESGSLWLAVSNLSTLHQYSADQLSSSGSPTPTVTITAGPGGTLSSPQALVFDPHAEGLPIRW